MAQMQEDCYLRKREPQATMYNPFEGPKQYHDTYHNILSHHIARWLTRPDQLDLTNPSMNELALASSLFCILLTNHPYK